MKLWKASLSYRTREKYWRDITVHVGTFYSKERAEKALQEKLEKFGKSEGICLYVEEVDVE